jgi:hypothetical protein
MSQFSALRESFPRRLLGDPECITNGTPAHISLPQRVDVCCVWLSIEGSGPDASMQRANTVRS